MSVGKRLKLAQARLHLAEAEIALMRTEHRLKMAAENAEIAELKSRVADLEQDNERMVQNLISIMSGTEAKNERLHRSVPEMLACQVMQEKDALRARPAVAEELAGALQLIATPKRPDGTYNRCREACEQIATVALAKWDSAQKQNQDAPLQTQ